MKKLLYLGALLALTTTLSAQSKSSLFVRVYVGHEGLPHLVNAKGSDSTVPKERDQVSVSSPQLAPDGQSAGWLIETPNCCTSNPVPTSLEIYSKQSKRLLGDGQIIHNWCFVAQDGSRVALLMDTIHSSNAPRFLLYNVHSGRLLDESASDVHVDPPEWAVCLKH